MDDQRGWRGKETDLFVQGVVKIRIENSFTTSSAASWRLPLLLKRRRNFVLT
jgi:hypothetical protein